MSVLEPLIDRSFPAEPDEVWAMPVVLRIEKATPPERTPLLEAAAAAALAVCLDPRAASGGEWHQDVTTWISGRIRKVARRARGAHWEAVQASPGVTIRVGDAEARALVPCRVVDTPRDVARLQITGSDLPADSPGPAPLGVPVLWLNPEVPMSAGKAAAQVGHATMLLAATLSPSQLAAWAADDFRCAVRTPEPAEWKLLLADDEVVAVRDAGFTEVAPGTQTVIAQPWEGLLVQRVGEHRFVGRNSRGAVVELGREGADGAFTPGELLQVAVAACEAVTAEELITRRIGAGSRFAVRAEADKSPHEYDRLRMTFDLDLSGLDADQREHLESIVRRAVDQLCNVSRTVEKGTPVDLIFGRSKATDSAD